MPRAEGPAGPPCGGLGAGRGRGEEAHGPATLGGSRKELLGRKPWSPSPPLGVVIQEESARALGEAYVVGLAFQGARMLFSACQPCMDMDCGPGGSMECFSNSKSSKRQTLWSPPVCPAIVGWWWENYLYLTPLSGGCRGTSIFTPLALSG